MPRRRSSQVTYILRTFLLWYNTKKNYHFKCFKVFKVQGHLVHSQPCATLLSFQNFVTTPHGTVGRHSCASTRPPPPAAAQRRQPCSSLNWPLQGVSAPPSAALWVSGSQSWAGLAFSAPGKSPSPPCHSRPLWTFPAAAPALSTPAASRQGPPP